MSQQLDRSQVKQMVRMGVDGCRGGWLVAQTQGKRGDFSSVSLGVASTLVEAIDRKTIELVLIDIPKGLLNDRARRIEYLARQLLKGQASTIFNVPVVDAVFADSYEDASIINHRMTGKKLSKQAWYLCPKIKELDELLAREPSLSNLIYESHPELVFRLMAGTQLPKKKDSEGLTARSALLERAGIPATQLVSALMNRYPRSVCFADDAIDALVLLLLAHSPSEDLDSESETDRRGTPINFKIPLRSVS